MTPKPTYEYIADMLDFADDIAQRIKPGDSSNDSYFMTLIYVEDIVDKYGRGLVLTSANEAGQDGHALLVTATQRLDSLRQTISDLSAAYQFGQAVNQRAEAIIRDWGKTV